MQIFGWDAKAVTLAGEEAVACAALMGGWKGCPVPTMLGVPLAMKRMGGPRQLNESLAMLMTVDPVTGFAPPEVLMSGLGKMLVARTDGADLTVEEVVRRVALLPNACAWACAPWHDDACACAPWHNDACLVVSPRLPALP